MKKKKEPDSVSVAYAAAGIIIVCLMTLFGISAFLSVNTIIIEGLIQYSPEEVAAAADVSRGDNLFYLNKKSAASKILSELPYINSVEITRDLPDKLIIEVTESKAVAYIPFAGDAIIIDSAGRVLEAKKMTIGTPVEIDGRKLIEIRGVPITEAVPGKMPVTDFVAETSFNAMVDVLAHMEREGVAKDVNYLDVAVITNMTFGYLDMYRIILGGLRDFKHKITGLPSMIGDIHADFSSNVRGTLDITDPTGAYRFIPDE